MVTGLSQTITDKFYYGDSMKKISLNNRLVLIQAVIALGILLGQVAAAHAVRIKEITEIQGVRQNQLVGYGLVVGLNGTGDGDKAKFTVQSLASMLEKMGMTVNPCLLYTSPSPRDRTRSRMPSSA